MNFYDFSINHVIADPLVKPIAHEMLNNPENYFKTAKEWTKKYASPELAQ